MTWYLLPATIGLLIKGYILCKSLNGPKDTKGFISLISIFAMHNLCEFIAYLHFLDGRAMDLILRSYYVTTIFLILYVVLYAIEICNFKLWKPVLQLMYAGTAAFCLVIVSTNLIVAGADPIGYAVTAVQGPYYLIFKIFVAAAFSATFAILYAGYKSAKDSLLANRVLCVFIALCPIFILGFVSVVTLSFGAKINAAGILPLCTTFFVWAMIANESRHRLTDLRRFLPLSPERHTTTAIIATVDEYLVDGIGLNEAEARLKKIMVEYKIGKNDHNVTRAADQMGVNRTTLHAWLKKYESQQKKSPTKGA